jgi:hypothetical protein
MRQRRIQARENSFIDSNKSGIDKGQKGTLRLPAQALGTVSVLKSRY